VGSGLNIGDWCRGLTVKTVIDGLEDEEDYRAFEASVILDYDARSARVNRGMNMATRDHCVAPTISR
jgi:hypothetical protein